MSTRIHPGSLIDPGARIGEGVEIGPFCRIEASVEIGDGTKIGSHNVFEGPCRIGKNNRFGNFCSVGAPPQDLGYKNDPTRLWIGDGNFFGDYVQLCRGTIKEQAQETRIGSNNFLMAYCHVGHDCVVGDHVIAANSVQLAGHVTVEDRVVFGGLVAVHQFARVGRLSMVSGGSVTSLDIPPFCRVGGWGCAVFGLNLVGLERNGFDRPKLKRMRDAYKILFRSSIPYEQALTTLQTDFADSQDVQDWVRFFRESRRGVVRERTNK